jgi:hypothetical protein
VLNAALESPVPHLRPPSAAEDTRRHTDAVDMLLRPPTAAEGTRRRTVAVAMSLRPPTVAEDTQRRTGVVATWHQGQPIAAVDMCHHRLTVVVAMWRPPHTAADAMLHRPHTAADAMLHHPPTAADAMLHHPPTAADATLHNPPTAADAMLHRKGSARRLQATVAAPPREACAVAAVAAALTVGVRVAAIPHAEAAKPGIAATMEGRVEARAQR